MNNLINFISQKITISQNSNAIGPKIFASSTYLIATELLACSGLLYHTSIGLFNTAMNLTRSRDSHHDIFTKHVQPARKAVETIFSTPFNCFYSDLGASLLKTASDVYPSISVKDIKSESEREILEITNFIQPPVKLTNPAELWAQLKEKTIKPTYLDRSCVRQPRFRDIFCPKATAVKLDINSDFALHANYVGRDLPHAKFRQNGHQYQFIASQAPHSDKVIWDAVVENKSAIIALTTDDDIKTCGIYYPEEVGQSLNFDDTMVKLKKTTPIDDLEIKTFDVSQNNQVNEVHLCHYKGWKDFSATNLDTLKKLIGVVDHMQNNLGKGVWIHCRAGVGRTGTLITSVILRDKIRRGEITKNNFETALIDLILDLRLDRGECFVQQQAQFELIYAYGKELLGIS